jgi:hypothetical protein
MSKVVIADWCSTLSIGRTLVLHRVVRFIRVRPLNPIDLSTSWKCWHDTLCVCTRQILLWASATRLSSCEIELDKRQTSHVVRLVELSHTLMFTVSFSHISMHLSSIAVSILVLLLSNNVHAYCWPDTRCKTLYYKWIALAILSCYSQFYVGDAEGERIATAQTFDERSATLLRLARRVDLPILTRHFDGSQLFTDSFPSCHELVFDA